MVRQKQLLILDRYLLSELAGPLVMSIGGFSVILISGVLFQLTDLIFQKRVAPLAVVSLLSYRIPSIVVLTLPLAVLLGTLLSVSRLVRDSEVTVVRAAGLRFPRLALVYLVVGLLVSGLTYLGNEEVVPWANHRYESTIRRIIYRNALPVIEENVFFKGSENRYFYIERVNTERSVLERVMIYQLQDEGYPIVITAAHGRYHEGTWVLEDGVRRTWNRDGYLEYEQAFESMTIQVPEEPEVFLGNQKTTDEMSRAELARHIRLFQRSGLKVRAFVVDYHLKLSLPLASLVFALLGAPLSLYGGKSGYFYGGSVSIAVMFVYYIATSVSRSMGINGLLHPLAAAWLPNGLFMLIGSFLMLRADRV